MSIRSDLQDAIKAAMKNKDQVRLETLRMAKGALLLKEKEGPKEEEITDSEAIAAMRSEIKKRQQSMETYLEHGRPEEVEKLRHEIAVFEEFLPKQLSEADLEARVGAYLAAHPEMNHAGKLTGAMKKELGDLADGKMLNEVCKRAVAPAAG